MASSLMFFWFQQSHFNSSPLIEMDKIGWIRVILRSNPHRRIHTLTQVKLLLGQWFRPHLSAMITYCSSFLIGVIFITRASGTTIVFLDLLFLVPWCSFRLPSSRIEIRCILFLLWLFFFIQTRVIVEVDRQLSCT